MASDKNLLTLKVSGKPNSLLSLTQEDLKPIRNKLLAPLGLSFDAPNKVALYLIGDHHLAVENFNDEAVRVTLEPPEPNLKQVLVLPIAESVGIGTRTLGRFELTIPPRTLVMLEY
jgi:hypothetical protein